MENGIKVEVIWFDQNSIEYLISCSNGYFSGQSEIYLAKENLRKFADALAGFPSSAADCREFELGTFNPDHADGGLKLRFYCLDSVGHAAVDVKLRGDACKALGEVESVALRIPVLAAGIDAFVSQIRTLNEEVGATAHLETAR